MSWSDSHLTLRHPDAPIIDLRSDTVTKPTEAMYERMRTAPVGDDGLDGDPTVRALEAAAATILCKEATLFVPSCTMANLLATLAHVERGEQVILEANSHMFNAERGSATFTGAFYCPVEGQSGAMDLDALSHALEGNSSRLRNGMVVMETSHNNAGGTVLPLDHMAAVQALAERHGAAVHIDGARLFNASHHLGVPPGALARYADSVALCLSKGLSAPVGAILAGPPHFVAKARALRRMLGGQQRQAGIMAAAGLEAINVMGERLGDDHARARSLSDRLIGLKPLLRSSIPQTNIVQIDVSASGRSPADWVDALASENVLVRPLAKQRLRCVLHRHIDDEGVARAAEAFHIVAASL